MSRRNSLYTGWQHRPHLVTMPESGRVLEMSILEICPGFVASADHLREIDRPHGFMSATRDHLKAFASSHQEALRPFRHVYGLAGSVPHASGDGTVLVPYVALEGASLTIGQRRVRSDVRVFNGYVHEGRAAFILYEPVNDRLRDLCCVGCNRS